MEGRGRDDDDDEGSGLSFCPSFNSYSSDGLAVLARAVALDVEGDRQLEEDVDDDFEFVPVIGDDAGDGFVISSDQVGPVFPVFNQDLLLFDDGYGTDGRDLESGGGELRSIMIPLKELFMEEEEEEHHHQYSSSEADEMDGIPEGSYCVWTPRGSVESTPSWCKKSNSTGSRSSKRWRFLDLVRRSNSDRKDSLVFLTPSSSSSDSVESKFTKEKMNNNNGKSSAVEVLYRRNKEGENRRRKSYLPYRQDLVGLFANVNSLGRTSFPPLGV